MPVIETGKHGKYYVKDNGSLFYFPEEWIKLMKLCNERQRISFNILMNTGARINEAQHIKFEDINYERNFLTLKVTKVRAKLGETRPVPRIIPISSKFSRYLKKLNKDYGPDDYLPMLKKSGLNKIIKKKTKDIRQDYKDFSVHNIRKTFECWLLALGLDSLKVAKHLGHTINVAAKSYVSPDIFSHHDKMTIRNLLDDLYAYGERRY